MSEIRAEGIWRVFRDSPARVRDQRIRSLALTAIRETFTRWVQDKPQGNVGLGVRFSPAAWDVLHLTPRGEAYTRRKLKFFGGRNLPYVSPRRTSHARDSVKVVGNGTTVAPQGGGPGKATQRMTVNLAAMNFPQNAQYRREFLAFDGAGKADAAWLQAQAQHRFAELIAHEIEDASPWDEG